MIILGKVKRLKWLLRCMEDEAFQLRRALEAEARREPINELPFLYRVLLEMEDYLAPLQNPMEQVVYRYLFRWTFLDRGAPDARVSLRGMSMGLASSVRQRGRYVGHTTVLSAVKRLDDKGHIKILRRSEKGTYVRVFLPEEIAECREAMKKGVEGIRPRPPSRPSDAKKLEVFERDEFRCRYCGAQLSLYTATVDHITPLSKGGDNSLDNLVTACMKCNAKKGARVRKPRPLEATARRKA